MHLNLAWSAMKKGGIDKPLSHMDEDSWVRRASGAVLGERFKGAIPLRIQGRWWGEIPILTLLILVALCLGIWWFLRTKLGQDLRAVGQDQHVAEIAGINVDRCRIIAVVLSLVLAAIGQIIWLQNMTMMNTYSSHEQVAFYAIAALLVGGATVTQVRIWNAIIGTVLFHTLIVVIATAGAKLKSPQIGEYLREFLMFALIGVTLAIHAWHGKGAPEPEESLGSKDVTGVL